MEEHGLRQACACSLLLRERAVLYCASHFTFSIMVPLARFQQGAREDWLLSGSGMATDVQRLCWYSAFWLYNGE